MTNKGGNKLTKLIMENPMTDGNEHLRDPEEPIEFIVTIADQEKQAGVTSVRVCTYGDKTFRLERRDPYGFWTIIPGQGQLPEKLKQRYTTQTDAARDLETYLRSK